MIECKDVSFSYYSGHEGDKGLQEDRTLKNVSCTIADGSFVLLCGASGCGKTTLTTAEQDACRIEHAISDESFQKLQKYFTKPK